MLCYCFFFHLNALASTIYDIDPGLAGEKDLVLLTDGRVLHLPQGSTQAMRSVLPLRYGVNTYHQDDHAAPSILSDLASAQALFLQARHKTKNSQCFNRAHVWAYEWAKNHQINSQKTWLFFTRRYIRKYAFEWWFHVAPSVVVKTDEKLLHRVMDVKYAREPLETHRWTNIFMRNGARCKLIERYSDYAHYPESDWCYIQRTSMFYYRPLDLEEFETWGVPKSNWYESEVRQAYADALEESI
jgi:hypothetical protein